MKNKMIIQYNEFAICLDLDPRIGFLFIPLGYGLITIFAYRKFKEIDSVEALKRNIEILKKKDIYYQIIYIILETFFSKMFKNLLKYRNQISSLKHEKDQLQQEIASLKSEKSKLQQEASDLKYEKHRLHGDLFDLEDALSKYKK